MPERSKPHPLDDVRGVHPDVTAATEIVGVGGTVTADSLLAGYSMGIFPMVVDFVDRPGVTAWFAPAERAVLRPPGMHISRSLRRSMRTFEITHDTAFEDVLAGCADPSREHGWITDDFRDAYLQLHRRGHAHSVEVWRQGDVVGGLIGIEIGGLFCADSMFHRATDASKAAVAGLCERVFAGPDGDRRMIDAQWLTDHLASLGFRAIPNEQYHSLVLSLLDVPGAFGSGIRTV